jgi:DNA-binding LacI/PurR family transcriptional regulator
MALRVSPPLTTVNLPSRDMARAAARILLTDEEDRSENRKQTMIFESGLVVRESTAKL